MDQQEFQRVAQELVNSKPEELAPDELAPLQEWSQISGQVSTVQSQQRNAEKQLAALKSQEDKLSGVQEYLLQKAVSARMANKDKAAQKKATESEAVKSVQAKEEAPAPSAEPAKSKAKAV